MTEVLKLRRFLESTAKPSLEETCEMCSAPLTRKHGHVIDIQSRKIICSCRPCYLLFTHAGAGGGRFRSVPERYVKLSEPSLRSSWESLEIPVGVAYFIYNSSLSKMVALYPSPGGATESGLSLETWNTLLESVPVLRTLEPDVEALLVCRTQDRSEAWIAPVDACYELVGRIRRSWEGFQGGEAAWAQIDAFFNGLTPSGEESYA